MGNYKAIFFELLWIKLIFTATFWVELGPVVKVVDAVMHGYVDEGVEKEGGRGCRPSWTGSD